MAGESKNKFKELIEQKKKNQKNQSSIADNNKKQSGFTDVEKSKFCYKDMLKSFDIPKRFKNKTINNYDPDRLSNQNNPYKKVKEYIENYEKMDDEGNWLVLTGGYGLGKTHLALAAGREILKFYAKEYVKDNPRNYRFLGGRKKAIFINSSELVQEIRDSYDNDMIDERTVMERYKGVELLIIDDLGTEKASDWQHEKMYLILNYRYEECKNTIITTNLNTTELKKQVSERVVERMIEASAGGEYLWKLKGESYRRSNN